MLSHLACWGLNGARSSSLSDLHVEQVDLRTTPQVQAEQQELPPVQ